MKKCRKILLILAAAVFAFALFALTACGGDDDGNEDAVKVTLDKTTITLNEGGTATLTATVTGSEEAVVWSASSDTVITITPNGNACTVTALAEGTAKVTATLGEVSAECNVKVNPADSGHEDEVSITLSKTKLTLKPEGTATLTATVKNSEETVKWAVDPDDDTIISVIPNGNSCEITAMATGSAKITASIGEVTAECTVTVSTEDVGGDESVTLSKSTLALKVGEDDTITATVENSDETVEWAVTPNDNSIVEISANGNTCTVTAKAEGTATVRATIGEEVYAECTVTVTANSQGGDEGDDDLPEWTFTNKFAGNEAGGSIWHEVSSTSITENMPVDIVVKVNGVAATPIESLVLNGVIKVHIFGSRFDSVEISFTFKDESGTAIAKASYSYEGEKAIALDTLSLRISEGSTDTVSITSVNGKTDITGLNISWSIDNNDVATIQDNGNGTVTVTAVKEGTATLTCTVGEGDDAFSKTCAITVVKSDEPPLPPVDISDRIKENNAYKEGSVDVINLRIEFTGDSDEIKQLKEEIDKDSTTISVTMNKTNTVEYTVNDFPQIYWDGAPNLYIHVRVQDDWTNDYVFTVSLKNAKGEERATGTFTKEAEKSLKLDPTKLTLTLVDGETVTDTVTATKTGKVEGDVEWTISDESVATIQDNGDGTVTVTAVAVGTATITATIGDLTQTCTVNVRNDDDPPPPPESDIELEFHHAYNDWYIEFTIKNAPEGFAKESYDYVKVYRNDDEGQQQDSNYFANTNQFQVYCAVSVGKYAAEYKFEFIKAGTVVATAYWTNNGTESQPA